MLISLQNDDGTDGYAFFNGAVFAYLFKSPVKKLDHTAVMASQIREERVNMKKALV